MKDKSKVLNTYGYMFDKLQNKDKSCMIYQLLILPLHKVGCISAKHSSKLDVLRSICTTFAP